jgi:hypothetical protein
MKASQAKYGKFAYSSAFAYSVPSGSQSLDQFALDSTLGFSDDGGEMWKTRRLCEEAKIEYPDGVTPILFSVWRPYFDVRVKTWLIPPCEDSPNWHLRVHCIEAGRHVLTADGGFAVRNLSATSGRALGPWDATKGEGTWPTLLGNYDVKSPEGTNTGNVGAFAVSRGAVGVIARERLGYDRTATIVNADPNTNLLESRTVIPTLHGELKKGERKWYLTAVYAKPATEGTSGAELLKGWEEKPKIPFWLVKIIGTYQN